MSCGFCCSFMKSFVFSGKIFFLQKRNCFLLTAVVFFVRIRLVEANQLRFFIAYWLDGANFCEKGYFRKKQSILHREGFPVFILFAFGRLFLWFSLPRKHPRKEVYHLLDHYLIEHCSPTLACLKTANLFSFACSSRDELRHHIRDCNQCLFGTGVSLTVLAERERSALVYVFRRDKLVEDLKKPGVKELLARYGYERFSPGAALSMLRQRFRNCREFPHEIGLFLGYPLGDVRGFIENGGKNCKCSGCWKVYGNEQEVLRLFEKYRKCREAYRKSFRLGKNIRQLTVSA